MALQLNVGSITSGGGIDVQGTVDQLMALQKAPLNQMQQQRTNLLSQKAVLSDIQAQLRNLEDTVQSLGDFTGSLSARSVQSSQAVAVTAAADSTAVISQHQIAVDHVATRSSWYSNPVNSETGLVDGVLTLRLGSSQPVTVSISNSDTLQTVADAINRMGAGIIANVINDASGSRLTLVSSDTGAVNEITVVSDTAGLGLQKSATATNASFTVDGVPIESASNTVRNLISGVTLNLIGPTNGSASLNVQADASQAEQAVNRFVAAYNSAIQAINSQFAYDPASKTAGPLAGDSALRTVQETLLGSLSYSTSNNNGIASLVSLGVNMEDDGTLTVDSGKLESALAGNYAAVQNFFQAVTPEGFSAKLNATLSSMLDSTTGAITVDLKGITDTSASIQDQVDDLQVRLETEQQSLLKQFEQVDALLRSYPNMMAQISAVLDALPPSSISRSK